VPTGCSDPGDDPDPRLVHRLEPLSLLPGILVRDRANGVVASAGLVDLVTMRSDDDLVHQQSGERAPVLCREVLPPPVTGRVAPAGPPRWRAGCAHELADHVLHRSRRHPSKRLGVDFSGSFMRSASFFCSCRWRISSVISLIRVNLSSSDRAILMASGSATGRSRCPPYTPPAARPRCAHLLGRRASRPCGSRNRVPASVRSPFHPPAARRAVGQTDQRVYTGPAKVLTPPAWVVQESD
jgi:hypothetical protein